MITVHHLNNSRSQRILWLLEELGLDYEIAPYQRDAVTRLAPPELKAVHPLGKSPVVEAEGLRLAESGAIVEYLIERHGQGRLGPPPGAPGRADYLHWLHFAEGSAMLPLLLLLDVGRLGEAGAPLHPRIFGEIDNHLAYVDAALAGRDYLVGEALTGADIQMSFVLEAAAATGRLAGRPAAAAYLERLHARPAYRRALERGGPYELGR